MRWWAAKQREEDRIEIGHRGHVIEHLEHQNKMLGEENAELRRRLETWKQIAHRDWAERVAAEAALEEMTSSAEKWEMAATQINYDWMRREAERDAKRETKRRKRR